MPHMSPMHWSMMFISSSLMLSMIYTNMFFLKTKQFNKKKYTTNYPTNWQWSQELKMNCKFIYGLMILLKPNMMYL